MKRKKQGESYIKENVVKVKRRFQYTKESVEIAKEEVRQGCSVLSVATKYNIPEATLRAKIKNKYSDKPPGPARTLSVEEESILVNWIFECGSKGLPVAKNQLLDSVKKICDELKKTTPFSNNRPGKKWFHSFLHRHPQIIKRVPENLNLDKVKVTEESLRKWFSDIEKYLDSHNLKDIDASRIFNCDETSVLMNPKPSTDLYKKGSKNCLRVTGNDEKENISVLFMGNAAGDLIPPFILYTAKSLPTHAAVHAPKEYFLGFSENGFMTSRNFYEYIANTFEAYLVEKNIQRPVILYLNSHVSHLTLHLSKFCMEHEIILIALHPNATHLIQPLDVSFLRTFKLKWQQAHKEFCRMSCLETIKRHQVAAVLQLAIKKMKNEQLLINGFKKCGLLPFNVENIDFTKLFIKEEDVNADTSTVSATCIPTTINKLQIIESILSQNQLTSFKMNKSSTWHGLVEDTNLFLVWYRLAHPDNFNNTTHEQNLDNDSPLSADDTLSSFHDDGIEPDKEPQQNSIIVPVQNKKETMQSHINKDEWKTSNYIDEGTVNSNNNDENSSSTLISCESIKQEDDNNSEVNVNIQNSIKEETNCNPDDELQIIPENCDYNLKHKENFSTVFVSCGSLKQEVDSDIEDDIIKEDPIQDEACQKESTDDSNFEKNHEESFVNCGMIKEEYVTDDSNDSSIEPEFDDQTPILDADNVTSRSNQPTECSKCGKKLKNLDVLRKHLKLCGVEPNYFCQSCPYKSKYKQSLEKHQKVHVEPIKTVANSEEGKSKHRYSAAYNEFKKWQNQHETDSFDEKIFLDYFEELSKTHAPPTLWARFSMLKATVNIYDNINIGVYKNLIAFLKYKNLGHKKKNSKVFSSSEISQFCSDAPDDTYLVAKVILIFGVTGACRREELTNITIDHIQDHDTMYLITVPKTKTGTERSFTIVGDFYKIVQQYIKLRPDDCDTDRFFLCYRAGKCMKQPIGINTIGTMPSRIAKYLQLPNPELYTGHSFRRTSAKLLFEAGGDVSILKRKGGWKSNTIADSYVTPISNKKGIGEQITSSIMISKPSTPSSDSDSDEPVSKLSKLDCNDVNIAQTTDQTSCERLPNSSTLNTDNVLNSENEGKSKECLKCKKIFENSKSLRKHIKLCNVEPNYSCEFCSYESKFKQCFKKHQRSHLESMKATMQGVIEGKSKRQYLAAYNDFKKWQTEQKTDSFDEELFLDYFTELSKTYVSSTLWARYSMLKATISIYDNVNIGPYRNLIAFIKKTSVGHKRKKSKVFTSFEVSRFCYDAPDDIYLVNKVVLILGVTGGCRREELTNLTMSNIKDHGTMYLITIPKMKTGIERSFTIVGDFYKIVQQYIKLRPDECDTDRFFLCYRGGKCTKQPIGINTIGAMPSRIAEFLQLPNPKLYTGHSFRRTSAKLLVEAGGSAAILKKSGIRTANYPDEDSSSNEKEIGEQITTATTLSKPSTSNSISEHDEIISKHLEMDSENDFVDLLFAEQTFYEEDSNSEVTEFLLASQTSDN